SSEYTIRNFNISNIKPAFATTAASVPGSCSVNRVGTCWQVYRLLDLARQPPPGRIAGRHISDGAEAYLDFSPAAAGATKTTDPPMIARKTPRWQTSSANERAYR